MNVCRLSDPRTYQITSLSLLLAYGTVCLDFPLGVSAIALTVFGALLAHTVCLRFAAHYHSDWPSAVISALSICLLLRYSHVEFAILTAALAVASKAVLRFGGRHLFNPSALALVLVTLSCDGAWLSPGQWGRTAWWLFAVAGAGLIVVTRARRADISLAFLAAISVSVFIRALWLGDPVAIAIHQLTNGALLLFAFFMISDPRTGPVSRRGRIVFGILIGVAAACYEFTTYHANGPILMLIACTPLVPLLDRVLPNAAPVDAEYRYRPHAPHLALTN